ncbi:MAG: sensor histidine kinase, partial [Spirochaeta sp.]
WPDSIILDFEEISGSFSQAGKQIRGMFQRLQALNLDLEEARHAAEVSSQAKTEFIAGMSHELRTPLNAIIGNAELLPRKDMSPESVQHVAHVIASSGRHLLGMINDILQNAGSYMRDLPVERRSVSIPVMVRDLELMFRMKALESGVQLVTEVDGESSGVWVIPERAVMQILVNLMHNAVKHTQDGEVRLAVEKHQDKLRFSVSDTGSGIPYDDQPYIFTPFYQAGEVSTKKEGLGLGLSICSQLLDAMGSRMEMKSTPGKGSVFSFAIEVEQDFSAVDVTPATVEEAAPKLPPDMQVPDGEVLEKLQHLARIGDIAGADHLLRADIAPQPQFSEFYELVRLKLEDFALPELVEILQRLLLRK